MTVDREQIRTTAEAWLLSADDSTGDDLARHCLTLLAELEQAEKHEREADEDRDHVHGRNLMLEARLTNQEALRKALITARNDLILVAKDGFDSTRGQKAVEAITRIDELLRTHKQSETHSHSENNSP